MERNQLKNRAVFVVAVVAVMATWAMGGVDADSHGAPLSSCQDMGAIHAVFPSQPVETCPFGITFDQMEITNDESLTVTLSLKPGFLDTEVKRGPEIPGYFTGYLLMAFDADNETAGPIGYFTEVNPTKGQFLDCFDLIKSAVTHVNANFKPTVEVVWTPPEDWEGSVIFRGSFTMNIATIWAKVPSEIVHVTTEPATTTTTTPATTTVTEPTTTPASAGHLSGSWVMTIFAIALASTPFLV
ncbi:putative defense protein 3 [Daphnia pulicaria]|uniref:putative defense protein 3 n=1 Tax=Daphnia pulicaria TaxID=35523 RepID=UPI001EEA3CFB|nr:putative defense protein 3 [Daphnia pulicaria]